MPQAAYATRKSARLDARVSRKEKDLIEAAARLRGISVTDFLRTTATDAANRIIRESEVLILAERSRRIFVAGSLRVIIEQSANCCRYRCSSSNA